MGEIPQSFQWVSLWPTADIGFTSRPIIMILLVRTPGLEPGREISQGILRRPPPLILEQKQ
jgi:hypothetical protein